jgi:hypothetical protein
MNTSTDKTIKIPIVVLALAEKVKMTPIAWNVKSDQVIIVFEQGPKLCFSRDEILEVCPPEDEKENRPVVHDPKPVTPVTRKLPAGKRK